MTVDRAPGHYHRPDEYRTADQDLRLHSVQLPDDTQHSSHSPPARVTRQLMLSLLAVLIQYSRKRIKQKQKLSHVFLIFKKNVKNRNTQQ